MTLSGTNGLQQESFSTNNVAEPTSHYSYNTTNDATTPITIVSDDDDDDAEFRNHFKRQKTTESNDGNIWYKNCTTDYDASRRDLASMIILHDYPINMVEHKGFRKFMSGVQPMFKMVSNKTMKRDIIKIYEEEKVKTMNLLEKNRSRIAISTDMWTASAQKKVYMAVTAHFIDDSWVLQKRLLRFVHVPHPHTGELLSDALLECLMDWNIDRKLSTLTVDTCSTNDSMVESLLPKLDLKTLLMHGGLFHVRCCVQVINQIVNEGLVVINDVIEKIRDTMHFWTSTPKRKEKFEEVARQMHIPCTKKLALDCVSRWDSTYLMLETALVYKNVFSRLKEREPQFKCLPSESDWTFAKNMCDRLEPFYNMTELFSRSSYPTSNVFFLELCEIRFELSKWLDSEVDEIKVMASRMIAKFEKYWNVVHSVFAIATVLDPRFKMRLIEFYFLEIYGSHYIVEMQRVKDTFKDLMKYYMSNSSKEEKSSCSSMEASSSGHSAKKNRSLKFEKFLSNVSSVENVKSELDLYLEESLLPRRDDFDILVWWKLNGIKYPILYQIAKDILAVPVTTIASESAFCIEGRHISPHRSQIHGVLLEALMCSQDWLWAEDKSTPIDVKMLETVLHDEDLEDEQLCGTNMDD